MSVSRQVLERTVERRVASWADKHGIEHIKLNIMGNRGFPDRLFLFSRGRPLFIEFKRPGGVPRKLQEFKIERLRKLGYVVHVCDNAADGIAILQSALETA